MDIVRDCAAWCRERPGRTVLADSLDPRAIRAAQLLAGERAAEPVLLGNPFEVRSFCHRAGIALPGIAIVDPARSNKRDAYAATLAARGGKHALAHDAASERLLDPLWFGAAMVGAGDADLCVAGNLSTTSDVLRAALRVIGLAEGNETLSSIFFMVAPDGGRVLGFADCSVVPEPSAAQLADIALSSAESFRQVTGEVPRVALLAFSSAGSASHPSLEPVREAVRLARQRAPGLLLDGELQFDAAFVPEVARQKVPASPLAGTANVFVFPTLHAGNIGYKIAQRLGGYRAYGPIVQGLRAPMSDLSRGCSAEDIAGVALIARRMAGKRDGSRAAGTAAPRTGKAG